ncbi:hypothetical protein [Ottowia sp. SB7-C50]|uniref:hypothetical protein n=1 Tax=Ottowia sp. SB7-C50 TaxID=3081231 RepID=UPI0029555788|nr:hypothetical protein [Ottowia sp. SB7-C50]WOP15939.1 hypothetical protein R0D99_02410 [Ottowia sp. SB7-C50]
MADVNAIPLRDVEAGIGRLQDEIMALGRLIGGVTDSPLRAALVRLEGNLLNIGMRLDRDCMRLAKEG